jgi:hypothetical protein
MAKQCTFTLCNKENLIVGVCPYPNGGCYLDDPKLEVPEGSKVSGACKAEEEEGWLSVISQGWHHQPGSAWGFFRRLI